MWQAVELDPATYLNWTGYTACVKTRVLKCRLFVLRTLPARWFERGQRILYTPEVI